MPDWEISNRYFNGEPCVYTQDAFCRAEKKWNEYKKITFLWFCWSPKDTVIRDQIISTIPPIELCAPWDDILLNDILRTKRV